jgi:DNA-binding FadR family transcriptional regulator
MQKIKRQKLYEQVAEQLEEMIASDQFAVGARLPAERALAEQCGVNRLVIREALRTLETKRMVRTRPGEGTFVISAAPPPDIPDTLIRLFAEDQLDLEAMDELLMIRRHLELAVIKSAGPKLSAEHFAHLEQSLAGFREGLNDQDPAAISRYDEAFHRGIARAGSGKVLESLVGIIWDIIGKYQKFYFTYCRSPEEVLHYLQQILESLQAGRVSEAARLMEKVLVYGDEEFKDLLQSKQHHFTKGGESDTP